ncbi:hypothetical protein DFH08DRAFT_967678 [Mycena albidolilacea]|uniref:Uncharacterized protein n=1 Tax=Mycena albidolilacea TaxID=1033008 RepID=A0AAD6ZM18_9AGAR|nr:hypothetical protein DFH08DRAFT_967678 [Mycena albidolilacea]
MFLRSDSNRAFTKDIHPAQQDTEMKLALSLLTLTASGILGVLGSPALQTSNVTTHPVPHGFTAFDVPESVDAAPAPLVPAHKDAVAASAVSTHYWGE